MAPVLLHRDRLTSEFNDAVAPQEGLRMLYDPERDKLITYLPYEQEFNIWKANLDRLDPDAYGRIADKLSTHFAGKQIETSSFVPGNNWAGKVWQPLYDACGQNDTQSGMFFGLIVWKLLMEDEETCWSFGKYFEDRNILGTTYFRIDCPES